jgi:hypothetical protein
VGLIGLRGASVSQARILARSYRVACTLPCRVFWSIEVQVFGKISRNPRFHTCFTISTLGLIVRFEDYRGIEYRTENQLWPVSKSIPDRPEITS